MHSMLNVSIKSDVLMNRPKEGMTKQEILQVAEIVSCDQLSSRDQRAVVFHILYALDADDYQSSVEAVVDSFCRGFLCSIDRTSSLYSMITAIVPARDNLDDVIKPLLHNWRFERVSISTRLILRIALWELMYTSTDAVIIINEAVELSKSFAESDSYKFVNGLLDEWLKRNRTQAVPESDISPSL